MNTNITTQMKTLLQITILSSFMMILTLGQKSQAQAISENVQLVKIDAKNIDHINYINVSLINKSENNIIVLERQKADKTFEWVNAWIGSMSPANETLLYSFKDEQANAPEMQYRISTIEDTTVLYLGYFEVKPENNSESNLNNQLFAIVK